MALTNGDTHCATPDVTHVQWPGGNGQTLTHDPATAITAAIAALLTTILLSGYMVAVG